VSLPWYMLDCRAWRALSLPARAAFIELARLYNGKNNGTIAMSARSLAQRLHSSKDTASRALAELEAKGFIETAKAGSFSWKQRHAAEYRLTLYRCDVNQGLSSKAFMRWEENSRSDVEDTTVRPGGHAQDNCRSQSDVEDCHGRKPTFHGPT
jgi:DNA-binding transcriptional MocR family regulator